MHPQEGPVCVCVLWHPDPTEEFEPRQRPLRGQVVRGRYVPLGVATRERASSAPAQSRRCGAPGGRRRRSVLKDQARTSQGSASELERRGRGRLPRPTLLTFRLSPGLSRRRPKGARRRPRRKTRPGAVPFFPQTRKNLI